MPSGLRESVEQLVHGSPPAHPGVGQHTELGLAAHPERLAGEAGPQRLPLVGGVGVAGDEPVQARAPEQDVQPPVGRPRVVQAELLQAFRMP